MLSGGGCSGAAEVTGADSQYVEDRLDADAVVCADPEDLDALPFPFTGPRHLPGRPPAAPEDAGERLQVRDCSERPDGFSGPVAVAGLRAVFVLVAVFVILRRHRCCLPCAWFRARGGRRVLTASRVSAAAPGGRPPGAGKSCPASSAGEAGFRCERDGSGRGSPAFSWPNAKRYSQSSSRGLG